MISWAHGAEMGVLSEPGLAFSRWLIRGHVGPLNDPKFNADYMIGIGDWMFTQDGERNGPVTAIPGVPVHPIGHGLPARTAEEVYTATVTHLRKLDRARAAPCYVSDATDGRPVARPQAGRPLRIATARPVFLEPFAWYVGRVALLGDMPVRIERVLDLSLIHI